MSKLPITNDYPPDWPEINARACEAAGHRCIRCGHPYRKGEHGKGEWSPCDEKCAHGGPFAYQTFTGEIRLPSSEVASLKAFRRQLGVVGGTLVAQWRILTVHHMSGDKADCSWFNLLVLCQRCHLTVQGAVNPETPYFLEHSDWFKPYVAAFYAKKYLKQTLSREEAMERLDELLKLERLA